MSKKPKKSSKRCSHSINRFQAAGTKRRLHRSQVISYRSQVTGYRSQVTENAIKKLDTAGLFMFIFCFISGYVTIRHMFGIDHASRCPKSKRTKLHIVLELEEFLSSFGCLETSKRDFVFAPREGTWSEALRGKCSRFPNYRLYCNVSCRFRFGLHTLLH